MSETPIELIIAAFNDEKGAEVALKELQAAKKEKLIGIQAAAIVRRDAKNKLHVREVGELTPKKGAVGGAVLGAAVGLLTGGAGLVLGAAGALIGNIIGRKHDIGFSNQRLETIGESLKPGSSAIVAVIEHKWVVALEEDLAELGADVMTAAIAADIAEQLAADKDLAYSALSTDDSFSVSRTAAGEDSVEYSDMVVTEESLSTSAAVATAEGVAFESTTMTEEGIAHEAGVITDEGAVLSATLITEDGVSGAMLAAVVGEEEAEEAESEEEA
ncbi:MAG: DUF1269 domain-containing protein [Pseudomonadales bacterium]|nr:DUF1269 domain-containing protein [Anaerolineales bacterium]MCB8918230.1 DUF1269 domain-containing protein [Ardenticatenaceae bacterium]MCP5190719.1 DUF1269 domain-containing protein [Pseudomonadales bacterium]